MATLRPSRASLTAATAAPRPLFHAASAAQQRRLASSAQSIAPASKGSSQGGGRERLVVLGSGWGGFTFLKKLDRSKYDLTLVSPNTYFSFTPLLAQASVGTLDFRNVIEPVRSQADCTLHHAWCESIDFANRRLTLTPAQGITVHKEDPFSRASSPDSNHTPISPSTDPPAPRPFSDEYTIDYDKLVISVGSYNQTFGTPGVKEHGYFLKDAKDARAIRWRIVELLEQAAMPCRTEDERREMLNFVVVGGGPTGSEWAAELHDLVQAEVKRLFPDLHPLISIRLLDAGPGILTSFDKSLSEYARRKFDRDGIDIRLKQKILRVEQNKLIIAGGGEGEGGGEGKADVELPFGLLVWSTGIKATPLTEQIQGVAKDAKTQSILTDPWLRVLEAEGEGGGSGRVRKEVFAMGDCAIIKDNLLPATAQVASQKARYLARLFNHPAELELLNTGGDGQDAGAAAAKVQPFRYSNRGAMASIGGARALIELPNAKEAGFLAWVGWRGAYTLMSMTWRNRLAVPFTWFLNFLFGRDLSRF
ncbi:uncharacterized protein PFL1_04190 [Pseudozyma flocculosa PF-1]|uniref:Related to NDE1 - mitochondrial cytosolically directed NADH dehydrogenase n=2 Tax=Pseudozyma flocculosa TaxID=84751 RepID=A0A5C3EVJ3_9BASI|nr:uncharacterized protein PFL1_04190 [Pseudozyma flocculosa PF-1]EPQ28363.1 hypothetical protein PFL1_04190 [Pseudozyma flocculosa PF-1]SPO35517.1 related to NDE1 - mitochondrial cytosolically directed NADH dehydrogenase [Pseudozyma flocculosa]